MKDDLNVHAKCEKCGKQASRISGKGYQYACLMCGHVSDYTIRQKHYRNKNLKVTKENRINEK